MEWVRGSFLRGGLCVMDEGGLSEMGEEEIFECGCSSSSIIFIFLFTENSMKK